MDRRLASQTILKLSPAVAGLAMVAVYLTPGARSQAQQSPASVAQPLQAAIPQNLISYAGMGERMLEATRTVSVTGPTLRGQPQRAALESSLEAWLSQTLAEKLPEVQGCNMQQRAMGFVAMLQPQNAQQAELAKALRRSAQDMSPYSLARNVLAAWEQVVEQISVTPCTHLSAPVAVQPAQPAIAVPVQAPSVPQAVAPAEPAHQPAKRRQDVNTPTRCLGLATALCEGGIGDVSPTDEVLPWTAEVSPDATSRPARGTHAPQAQGRQAGWSTATLEAPSRE